MVMWRKAGDHFQSAKKRDQCVRGWLTRNPSVLLVWPTPPCATPACSLLLVWLVFLVVVGRDQWVRGSQKGGEEQGQPLALAPQAWGARGWPLLPAPTWRDHFSIES